VDGLGAQRLGAEAGAELVAIADEDVDAEQVEADLDRLDDLEVENSPTPPASKAASGNQYEVVSCSSPRAPPP
jgi:hypothetical protein